MLIIIPFPSLHRQAFCCLCASFLSHVSLPNNYYCYMHMYFDLHKWQMLDFIYFSLYSLSPIPFKSIHVCKSGCCIFHGRQPSPLPLPFLYDIHSQIPPTLDLPFSEILGIHLAYKWTLNYTTLCISPVRVSCVFPCLLCNSLATGMFIDHLLYSSLRNSTHLDLCRPALELGAWSAFNQCLFI